MAAVDEARVTPWNRRLRTQAHVHSPSGQPEGTFVLYGSGFWKRERAKMRYICTNSGLERSEGHVRRVDDNLQKASKRLRDNSPGNARIISKGKTS
jgi:hypothetical protein